MQKHLQEGDRDWDGILRAPERLQNILYDWL